MDSGMNSGRFRTPSPPVHRASTVLFDDIAHLVNVQRDLLANVPASLYATFGTPTTAVLAEMEEKIAEASELFGVLLQ